MSSLLKVLAEEGIESSRYTCLYQRLSRATHTKSTFVHSEGEHLNVDSIILSITIQSLLNIDSRSFSHFLNAIERNLPVLRDLSNAAAVAVYEAWRQHDYTGAL